MLDFHSHLMPAVDDGAADIDESRNGIKAMLADGITGIITTPHIAASLIDRGMLDRYLEKIDKGWSALQTLVEAEFPKLRMARGFEVMLDVPHPKLDNPLLRLAGTRFVLIEFPFMSIPPNSAYALRELKQTGWLPILGHPERYANMDANLPLISDWKTAGALLQVNAGSLLGHYGARAKKVAWWILERGFGDYMCSDYHSRGKCALGAGFAELRRRGLDLQADSLAFNAKRVVRGEEPQTVEPFEPRPESAWKKVFRRS